MEIALTAQMALGFVFQWAAFAPKKVPAYVAWGALVVATVALWWWTTPDAAMQFQTNWRTSVASIVSFLFAAKGTGSTAKAFGLAPGTDTKP